MAPTTEPGPRDDPESTLRPLRAAGGALHRLRTGSVLHADELREAVVQVAFAIESSLRRLLRDDPTAALPVRLRALAPGELRAEDVLSELRQHDRVSLELAALVHDLLGLRAELRGGRVASPADAVLALQAADRLEDEVLAAPAPVRPLPPPRDGGDDVTVDHLPEGRPGGVPASGWVAGLVGVLLVLGAVLWWNARPDTSHLDQGIALFRSGSYADAASHFYRYSQDNPDQVVPHLYLARIHRRMQRTELAAEELRIALDLTPEDAAVHRELGFLLLDTGRPEVAVERFRNAISLDRDAAQSWVGLVRALREAGRPDAAARVLQQAPAQVRALLSGSR